MNTRNVQKIISGISICALLSVMTPLRAQAVQFSDVQGTVYQTAYTYLADRSIVQGYNDGTGKPYTTINRAETLKVLMASQSGVQTRLEWFQRNLPPLPLFSDVAQTEWYAPFLEVAFENKVVNGYPNGTFKPANSVTVEEALAMLLRTYKIPQSEEYAMSENIQNAPNQWYTPLINTAIAKNLISKREKLVLGTPISRGQFFDIVYRLDSIVASNESKFIDTTVTVATTVQPSSAVVSPTPTVTTTVPNSGLTIQRPANYGTTTAVPSVQSQYQSAKPFAISIPSVGINDLAIVRPTDYSAQGLLAPLQNGVGHLFSFPGGGGKIMVYGHSSSYPWDTSEYSKIFRKINEAKPGDKIYVTYDGKVYTYQVTFEETIPAADTSRFQDDGSGEKLILYTCWPPDSIEQRYLVHAVPI